MEGVWWAIGALFTLILALFGYMFQCNNNLHKEIDRLLEKIQVQADRSTRLETTIEPLKEITMMAVPKMLNLHGSGDVLEEAFQGPPDERKLDIAEARVEKELLNNPAPDRLLPLALAKWLIKVRRRELEEQLKGSNHDIPDSRN